MEQLISYLAEKIKFARKYGLDFNKRNFGVTTAVVITYAEAEMVLAALQAQQVMEAMESCATTIPSVDEVKGVCEAMAAITKPPTP